MPNFYANWYPTRLLLKSKPSASATASATVAEVFPSTASATAQKVTFGRPLVTSDDMFYGQSIYSSIEMPHLAMKEMC